MKQLSYLYPAIILIKRSLLQNGVYMNWSLYGNGTSMWKRRISQNGVHPAIYGFLTLLISEIAFISFYHISNYRKSSHTTFIFHEKH
jgi:hypothetical protein